MRILACRVDWRRLRRILACRFDWRRRRLRGASVHKLDQLVPGQTIDEGCGRPRQSCFARGDGWRFISCIVIIVWFISSTRACRYRWLPGVVHGPYDHSYITNKSLSSCFEWTWIDVVEKDKGSQLVHLVTIRAEEDFNIYKLILGRRVFACRH